ncbi:MAG: SdrD B-like domain-containing protein, partial [Patescibacteria group bacterium]
MFQYSLKKPTWQLRLTKGLTIIAGITMVFNMSALGVLIAPTKAYAAIQYTLEGQQKDLTFTTGNICGGSGGCFAEGENVPFKLTIAGLTDGKTYSAKIQHDYKDSAGVEGYVNFNTPGTWNGSASSVSLSSPTTSAGLPNTKTYTITFTATSSTVQLKWNALLSQNAGEWNGAQLHARLVKGVQQESIGNKEVPIQPDKIIIRTLGIAKSDNPDPINLNAQTTYTIVVTNTGEQDETVTVVDTLPAQMVYVTDSANPAPTSVVGSVITWSGIVLAKTSGSRTITFNATGAKNGTWTNTASISAVGLDPKSDTEPTTVLGQCVPTISKSVQNITHPAGPNMPGDILEYTIFYQNTGSANCTGGGVRVNDTIPTGLTYNGTHSQTTGTDYGYQYNEFGTANPNPQAGASMVSWNANILTPKESGTVTFQTTINSVPECQSAKITNVAKMYGDQFSSGITSNEVITDVTASCPSTLTVIKHVDNTNGGTATSANWTMHVAKANTDVFTFAGTENPGITKTLDAGTYNVSETNGPVNYALTYSGDCDANGNITIANGEHKTCTLTNAYTPYCGDGIVNQASEQCDDGNTNNTDECSNTCQIQSCNMIIEKFVSDNDETLVKSNTASVGETLTYTLKYKNIGNAYCTGGGVRVDDTIPAGTTYTGWHTGEFNSAEPSSEAYYGYTENLFGTANPNPQAGASMVSWNAGYVQPNEQGTLKFTVTVDPLAACQELNINNKGIVYADQIPGGVWSNEVTTHVAADCYGKLKVKKIVDAGTMTPDSWSFTVGTTTLTPAAGTDYVVFDLPAGTYSATENTIAGYHQVSNSCENVPVVPNETAECQIHNTQDVGQLTVIKHVAGSTEPAASWTMNVAGTTPLSFAGSEAGTTNTVVAGNYTVTETKTGPAGYTLSYSGDCDASGKVTIANGDNKTCTLTNTRDIGSIKVIKNVDTDGDGDVDIAGATDWTWDISGGQQNIATGSSATVDTGDYTINEDQKTNFHVVSLVCGTQDLGATESATISVAKDQNVVCTFTNALDTGRVDGYKFEDMNGNGTWDAGEPVIQGVEIKLSNGWTDTTDVNGYYSFELVPTGTYSLEETIDANWINTTPNPVTNVAVTKDNTTSVNFGNFELGRIYGTKWNDLNGDYLNTDGDQSIQGWYICLNGQTNCVVTDENGNYEFTGLTAGHYSVTETILPGSGWTPTFPLTSYEIDIVSGSNEKADFFNFQLGKISGYKWNDLNGDGKWDAGEPGIEGWTINLWKDAGVAPFETVTTDNTGRYEFDGLLHGSYVVTEGSRTGWTLTSPDNHYGPLVVTSGSVFDKDNNFGNFKNVNINAYKFNDVDGDGVKDAEDLPIKDWKMYLDGGQEKLTDVNGMVT